MPGDPRDRPVLVFDVNETLSDMAPLRARFEEVGAPGALLPEWFAAVLRDGFALTAAGRYADFAAVARDAARAQLLGLEGWQGSEGDAEEGAGYVVAGFGELEVHPDVADGVRTLAAAGFRLVSMTNGDAALTGPLLERAGVRGAFEALLDVSAPRCWKPAPGAYRYALERVGARVEQGVLVAVHPWDVAGAQAAGLAGAWVRRGAPEGAYPASMGAPDVAAEDLVELARRLG